MGRIYFHPPLPVRAWRWLLSAYCKKRVRWADLEGLEADDRAHREEAEEDGDRRVFEIVK